jgi:hypothetical protein
MKKGFDNPWAVLTMILFTSVALWAQNPGSTPPAGSAPLAAKVEGLITTGLSTSGCGMPSFTVKTKEGKEISIHFETLKDSGGKIFIPKMGETINVAGTTCCEIGGQSMIHATEIILAKTTYRAPAGSSPGMMPGMGMMMGHEMGGTGAIINPAMAGQSRMMCPGMGQDTTEPRHLSSGMTGMVAMTCCSGAAGVCSGCGTPQAPAGTGPAENKE